MAKISYIVGGTSSGKTRWAINFFETCDDVLYMSTEEKADPDLMARIDFNCKRHGIEWDIKLQAYDLLDMIKGRKFSILNNLGAYTNRVIEKHCPDISQMDDTLRKSIERQIIKTMTDVIEQVKEDNGSLLVISTELGCCPIPKDKDQLWFRKILCNVNQRIANVCDEVFMASSGVIIKMKG